MRAGQFYQSAAGRRYIIRFVPTMTLYVVLLLGARWAIASYHPIGIPLAVLAASPALPLVGLVAIMGLYLAEERDEYLRNRLIRGILAGTGLMLAMTTVWGFLEEGGVVRHFPAYWAFILWCIGLGLAQAFYSWRDILGGGR